MSFWEARFLWQEPMLAAVVAAALLGYLGFFVVLRRMAFLSASLSQVSGLGVAVAFFVGSYVGLEPHAETPWWLSPALFALAFSCGGAALLTLTARARRVAPETIVALAYLLSSALVIVVLSNERIAQEAHEITDLLFGNAVVVKREHVIELCVVAVLVTIVHAVFFKDFLLCSFDAETARSMGYAVKTLDLALHMSLAVCVAVSTRAIGALPVFGFLVLPAGAALIISERLKVVLALSIGLSVACAALGYWLSWVGSLPTGPVMVALSAGVWAIAGLKRVLRGGHAA